MHVVIIWKFCYCWYVLRKKNLYDIMNYILHYFVHYICLYCFISRQMTGISVTGLPYLKPDADAGNYDDDLYLTFPRWSILCNFFILNSMHKRVRPDSKFLSDFYFWQKITFIHIFVSSNMTGFDGSTFSMPYLHISKFQWGLLKNNPYTYTAKIVGYSKSQPFDARF